MTPAQYAVAAHSHAYESKQPSSTTSYPVREQSSMASRKCRAGLGHPVREYVEIGHDPQRLTRPAGPWPARPRADLAPTNRTDTVGAGCEAGPPFLVSPVSLASGDIRARKGGPVMSDSKIGA